MDNIRDIFGNEHVTDKMCLNVLKSIFDVLKEIRNNYIEGSVYMSKKPLSTTQVMHLLNDLIWEYPYLTKCFREIHQADVFKVHSLSKQFEYDGTPGRFAKQELTQKMKPKHRSR